jgi:hypothetical protein
LATVSQAASAIAAAARNAGDAPYAGEYISGLKELAK